MHEFILCRNDECPSQKKCIRFLAMPDLEYPWFEVFEFDAGKGKCERFVEHIDPRSKDEKFLN